MAPLAPTSRWLLFLLPRLHLRGLHLSGLHLCRLRLRFAFAFVAFAFVAFACVVFACVVFACLVSACLVSTAVATTVFLADRLGTSLLVEALRGRQSRRGFCFPFPLPVPFCRHRGFRFSFPAAGGFQFPRCRGAFRFSFSPPPGLLCG